MRISDWSSDVCSSDLSGLVERQHPGKRKTGRQVTFSTDLIYDVLRKYEPDDLLLKAAWVDARARMTDVGRLADLLERAAGTMLPVDLPRVSPPAVPVLILIGRAHVAQGRVYAARLIDDEDVADEAQRRDSGRGCKPPKVARNCSD